MIQPYATLALLSALRETFGVQLYKNNARALLSRILSILNLDWLQHARSVRRVYELVLMLAKYILEINLLPLSPSPSPPPRIPGRTWELAAALLTTKYPSRFVSQSLCTCPILSFVANPIQFFSRESSALYVPVWYMLMLSCVYPLLLFYILYYFFFFLHCNLFIACFYDLQINKMLEPALGESYNQVVINGFRYERSS